MKTTRRSIFGALAGFVITAPTAAKAMLSGETSEPDAPLETVCPPVDPEPHDVEPLPGPPEFTTTSLVRIGDIDVECLDIHWRVESAAPYRYGDFGFGPRSGRRRVHLEALNPVDRLMDLRLGERYPVRLSVSGAGVWAWGRIIQTAISCPSYDCPAVIEIDIDLEEEIAIDDRVCPGCGYRLRHHPDSKPCQTGDPSA